MNESMHPPEPMTYGEWFDQVNKGNPNVERVYPDDTPGQGFRFKKLPEGMKDVKLEDMILWVTQEKYVNRLKERIEQ